MSDKPIELTSPVPVTITFPGSVALDDMIAHYVRVIYTRCGCNKVHTARLLKIDRRRLYRLLFLTGLHERKEVPSEENPNAPDPQAGPQDDEDEET